MEADHLTPISFLSLRLPSPAHLVSTRLALFGPLWPFTPSPYVLAFRFSLRLCAPYFYFVPVLPRPCFFACTFVKPYINKPWNRTPATSNLRDDLRTVATRLICKAIDNSAPSFPLAKPRYVARGATKVSRNSGDSCCDTRIDIVGRIYF